MLSTKCDNLIVERYMVEVTFILDEKPIVAPSHFNVPSTSVGTPQIGKLVALLTSCLLTSCLLTSWLCSPRCLAPLSPTYSVR